MTDESRPLDANRVYLTVGGEIFDDFTSYNVGSNLLHGTDGFMFTTPWRPSSVDNPLVIGPLEDRGLIEGARCALVVATPAGLRQQLVGKVESVDVHTSKQGGSVISVSGSDHMAPIIDSNAMAAISKANVTFRDVVFAQLGPFGFATSDIVVDNDANRMLLTGKPPAGTTLSKDAPIRLEDLKLEKAKPQAGETVYAFLSRHAKRFGLMIWGTGDGKVVVGRPNYEQKPLYSAICRTRGPESNNIEEISRKRSIEHRPSVVHVYGHTSSHDFTDSPIHAFAEDPYVKSCGLYRPLTIHDNACKTLADAKQRAEYEVGIRRMGGRTCSPTMKGHQAIDGAVYAIDTMIDMQWEAGDIVGPQYVVRRTFKRSKQASTTTLDVVPPYSIVLGEPAHVPAPQTQKATPKKIQKSLTPMELEIAALAGGDMLVQESGDQRGGVETTIVFKIPPTKQQQDR